MRSKVALAGIFWLVFLIFLAAVPGGFAQNTSSIFITPVPDAPFTGIIHVEHTIIRPDGQAENLMTIRDVAREMSGTPHFLACSSDVTNT